MKSLFAVILCSGFLVGSGFVVRHSALPWLCNTGVALGIPISPFLSASFFFIILLWGAQVLIREERVYVGRKNKVSSSLVTPLETEKGRNKVSLSSIIYPKTFSFPVFISKRGERVWCSSPLFVFSLILLLSGGGANTFERLFFGCVTDYIYYPFDIFVGNLADIAIVFGCVGVVVFMRKSCGKP